MSVLLAATAAGLFAIGTYLVLQRKLSRIIIGLGLITHGANVLMLTAGRRGTAPIVGRGPAEEFSDPLPQALALTAISVGGIGSPSMFSSIVHTLNHLVPR